MLKFGGSSRFIRGLFTGFLVNNSRATQGQTHEEQPIIVKLTTEVTKNILFSYKDIGCNPYKSSSIYSSKRRKIHKSE